MEQARWQQQQLICDTYKVYEGHCYEALIGNKSKGLDRSNGHETQINEFVFIHIGITQR